jgi:pimeloyl-ACP methyl ester carboxylesterase
MPTFERAGVHIHYEEAGAGFPVLLLAPGGMRSSIPFWDKAPFHPVRELSDEFRVIAMDQRNAGRSSAPITAEDGWHSYTDDHLALLDHLGVQRAHLLGGCIGAAFSLALIERAPERVASAILQQPIGLSPYNREVFYDLFDSWADELEAGGRGMASEARAAFRERMYGGDFVFSVPPSVVEACPVPLLVLRGDDIYHPSETSTRIAELAPRADLIPSWKGGEDLARARVRVREFLRQHTPAR